MSFENECAARNSRTFLHFPKIVECISICPWVSYSKTLFTNLIWVCMMKIIYEFDDSGYWYGIIWAACDTDVERHKWRTIQPTSNNIRKNITSEYENWKLFGGHDEVISIDFQYFLKIYAFYEYIFSTTFHSFSLVLSLAPSYSLQDPYLLCLFDPVVIPICRIAFRLPFVPMRSVLIALKRSVQAMLNLLLQLVCWCVCVVWRCWW